MKSRVVTVGVYLNDYEKVENMGFKEAIRMILCTKGDVCRVNIEPMLYKAIRVPVEWSVALKTLAEKEEMTVVSYTAGRFYYLVRGEI